MLMSMWPKKIQTESAPPAAGGSEPLCPLIDAPCRKHGCTHYQKLIGTNPQTGEPQDEYGCAHIWANLLTIELSASVRRHAAATDAMRNEAVRGTNRVLEQLAAILKTS